MTGDDIISLTILKIAMLFATTAYRQLLFTATVTVAYQCIVWGHDHLLEAVRIIKHISN